MGDIFDDVKAMEDAELASSAEEVEDSGDTNFNASELDDIMAEIDNLEKDFEADLTVAAAATQEVAKIEAMTETETVPVVEVQAEVVEVAPEIVKEEMPIETLAETKVLTFEKKTVPAMPELKTNATSNVALTATGNMALNLTFKIGEEDATLVIDQEKGLFVSFSGVELSLHAEKGCTIEMANGVSFTVPVQNGASSSKKKSA